jgi:hypothetical protein
MTADTLRDIRHACKRAREHAQSAADLALILRVLPTSDDMLLAKAESNLRLARVACDAALERVARLRASRED